MAKLESKVQADFIKKIERRFQGCIVLKNDATYKQGVPDLLVLYGRHWAAVEMKRDEDMCFRPNQEWYLERMGSMSFSALVWPGCEEDVLDDMARAFGVGRRTRPAQPELLSLA